MEIKEIEGSYRTASFEKAVVRDAMRPGVVSCTSDTPLRTVARIMSERHIHSVVVTHPADGEGSTWNVVTDVDLLGAVEGDIEALTAGEIAASELPTVSPEETLPRAAQVMNEHQVNHILVVDGGQAVGVLSSLDIAGILAWGVA